MSDAAVAGTPAGREQVLAGRYRLVRLLAEGGMAAVWEGRDEILARPVAVKVPHAALAADPTFRERFRREAVAAARLAHPGIVATYDTGADGSVDFIVMELVPGRTVRDLVGEGRVSPEVAVPLMAQVAEALDVAHRAGLVHRDIKPANLLLVEDGPAPRVKVADFGVARAQETIDRHLGGGDITREGIVVGTARYLAPEQVAARPLDGRTDVYAVGCVLHEMLAGQPPFVRDTDLATALAQLTEPAPSLSSLGVSVEPVLERLVEACLAKDPARRPGSALLLGQQLRALTGPTPSPPTAAVPMVELAASDGAPSVAPAPASVPAGAVAQPGPGGVGQGAGSPPGAPGPATVALPAGAGHPPAVGPPAPVPQPPGWAAPRSRDPSVLPAASARRGPPRPARSSGSSSSRHGTRTVRRPVRSRAPLVIVASLVVAALATALLVVALPRDPQTASAPRAVAPQPAGRLVVTGVRSFDPEADGRENDSQLPRLVDGDPATTWSSENYNQPPVFGNLKKGVGVVIALDERVRLGRLRVRSPSRAWAAQVHVAAEPASTLAGWGSPVTSAQAVDGDLDMDLDGRNGAAVLLWFTNPGRTGQVVVRELELSPA